MSWGIFGGTEIGTADGSLAYRNNMAAQQQASNNSIAGGMSAQRAAQQQIFANETAIFKARQKEQQRGNIDTMKKAEVVEEPRKELE